MSASIKLPQNARLADIASGLKNPIEYVRNVLAALVRCGANKDNENEFFVHLSLQSDPAAPDYVIIEIMDDEGGSMDVAVLSGKTHKDMSYDKARAIYWSHGGDSFTDVQKLIGDLRSAAKARS